MPEPRTPTESHRTTRVLGRRPLWYRIFRENLAIKAMSLIITLVIFWLVREDKGQEVDIEVPVVLSNMSERDVFVGEMPKVVRVRVRDRWSRVVRVLERKPNPYLVDLRGFSDQTVYVFDGEKIRQLLGIPSIKIQSIYPSDFVVRLEPKVERIIPVRANLVEEAPEGYEVIKQKVSVEPAQVRVWGAKSSVHQVNELLTYPVNLAGLEKDVKLQVKIQKPALPFIFLDVEEVAVYVPVRTLEGRLALEDVPVEVRDCPEANVCRIEPGSVKATLVGPRPRIVEVEKGHAPIEVVARVEEDLPFGKRSTVVLECRRPAELECRLSPHKVTLTITKAEDSEQHDIRSPDGR